MWMRKPTFRSFSIADVHQLTDKGHASSLFTGVAHAHCYLLARWLMIFVFGSVRGRLQNSPVVPPLYQQISLSNLHNFDLTFFFPNMNQRPHQARTRSCLVSSSVSGETNASFELLRARTKVAHTR